MRITSNMMQRNVLADLNVLSEKLAKTQGKAASGKEISRPSDDPYNTAKAMSMRQTLGATAQYKATILDSKGWQDSTDSALSSIGDYVKRARDLLLEGSSDTSDDTARQNVAAEIDQIIQGVKETANASYSDKYLMSGTATGVAPYTQGPDDTYHGNLGGLDPTVPGVVREIGPGVTMTINTTAVEFLGQGRANPGDGGLLNTLRDISDHLKAGDSTSLRDIDLAALDKNFDSLIVVTARNGAQSNRLDSADSRLDDVSQAVTEQLSNTEDADIAKTLIDFNSQTAAYQAALRAGANIVQSSLMDFLR